MYLFVCHLKSANSLKPSNIEGIYCTTSIYAVHALVSSLNYSNLKKAILAHVGNS